MTNIVFMGTPEFARIVLKKLFDESFAIKAVFAQPDKPSGRGKKMHSPPVAEFAKENGLPLFQPDKLNDPLILEQIKKCDPDYIIVAAYGKFLPKSVLSIAKKDCLNVHGSLLPFYRGAAPINYAVLDGNEKTGVTIMRMIHEMDAGPMFLKKQIQITKDDNAITMTEKLAHLGAEALVEALDKIENENLKPVDQDSDLATFAPKLTRELSPIEWDLPAQDIFNQIRALLPWPIATTTVQGKLLKVYSSEVLNQKSNEDEGTIVHIGPAGWTVTTGDQDLLIKEVQLEGKKRMNAFDLAHGLRLEVGAKLG